MTSHRFSTHFFLTNAFSALLAFGLYTEVYGATFDVVTREDLLNVTTKIQAAQFLSHATFGPTEEEISDLATRMRAVGTSNAASEWIDQQFAKPATLHQPMMSAMITDDASLYGYTLSNINTPRSRRTFAWWHIALRGDDPLRQRTAWALSQIFSVGDSPDDFNEPANDGSGTPRWLGMGNFYDKLVSRSFDTYRDVLGEVTVHGIMGNWLSFARNQKATATSSPDENYAREVMQLFSIGLYQLEEDGRIQTQPDGTPTPTYGFADIKTFARVFTGYGYFGSNNTNFTTRQPDFQRPMVMVNERHDTDAKTLLNGTVLPAGRTGTQDVNDALDNLFQHPSCPPFVCRLLIQRLVKSNPSRAYLQRVVNVFKNNGSGIRGDLKAVVKAILLDPEAWQPIRTQYLRNPARIRVTTMGSEDSRLQEPVLRFTRFIRAMRATSDYRTGRFMIGPQTENFGQSPYQAPSVFNFYLPDYQPAGDLIGFVPSSRIPNEALVAPEFQILNSVTANRGLNTFHDAVANGFIQQTVYPRDVTVANPPITAPVTSRVIFNFDREQALANDPVKLVEHLDLLLCGGTLNEQSRDLLVSELNKLPSTNNAERLIRAKAAVMCVLTSPGYMVCE